MRTRVRKICYITTIKASINSFFISQLNYLSNKGFELVVISDKAFKYSEKLSPKVRRIDISIPRGVSLFGTLKAITELIRIFQKERFDIVQYSTPNASFCAAIAAKFARVKVRNYHMMGFRYLGFSGIKREVFRIIEKLTCNLSTDIECVSRTNRQLGIDEGIFTAEKSVVVWNGSTGGVDTEKFNVNKREMWRARIRSGLEIRKDDFVFLFAGRITKDKGINELLKAFMTFNPEAKLIMVGDQEGVNTLNQELWKKASLDQNIIIRPGVSNVEEYYAAADCLILPSYREGFGTVIIEATSVGTPCIVTNIPGPSEVVDNIGGYKCNVKDVSDLRIKMGMAYRDKGKSDPLELSEKAVLFYDSNMLNKKILERKKRLLKVEEDNASGKS